MSAFVPQPGDHALVTGAGSGIGRALASHFAAKGMAIIALDIDGDSASEVASECGNASLSYACDVTDPEALLQIAADLKARGIVPSILWINAGVGSADRIVDARTRTIEWLMAVNVMGPMHTARAFLPAMRKAKPAAHVGVTASSASVTPVAGPFTLYATTKQMTAAVAEALAAELADDDIGVTILCPGILDTQIWNAARVRPDQFGGARETPDAIGDHWRSKPDAGVISRGVDETLAAGGGWCIIATEEDTGPKMEQRHQAQQAGFKDYVLSEGDSK